MKLIIPCNSHSKKRHGFYAMVMDLTKEKIESLLQYMTKAQLLANDDPKIEGLVLADMGTKFIKRENNDRCVMITVEDEYPKGSIVLPAYLTMTVSAGLFSLSGIPENTDLVFDSIAVHMHHLVQLHSRT